MDYIYKYKIWTNLFFLIPLGIAFFNHLYLYIFILIGVFANSLLYHFFNQKRYEYSDKIFAWLLMGTNLLYAVLGRFKFPYFLIALICVAISLHFYFKKSHSSKQYNINHGLWHTFSAIITLFCMLTFLYQ